MSCFSKIGEKESMRKGEKGESERSSEREDKRQGSCWPTLRQPTTRSQGACSRGYSGTGMLRAPLSPTRPFLFSFSRVCVCVCGRGFHHHRRREKRRRTSQIQTSNSKGKGRRSNVNCAGAAIFFIFILGCCCCLSFRLKNKK